MSSKPVYLRALEALRRREGLFRVFVFTLVTALFWIGFSIFQAQSQTKVSVDIRKHTEPLNPNINRAILEELSQRKRYTPEELQQFPLYERIVDDNGVSQIVIAGTVVTTTDNDEDEETPEPIVTPDASESAQPTETPTASDSGTISPDTTSVTPTPPSATP